MPCETRISHVLNGKIEEPQGMLGLWNPPVWEMHNEDDGIVQRHCIVPAVVWTEDADRAVSQAAGDFFENVLPRYVLTPEGVFAIGEEIYGNTNQPGWFHGFTDKDFDKNSFDSPQCYVTTGVTDTEEHWVPLAHIHKHIRKVSPDGIQFHTDHFLGDNGPILRINKKFHYRGTEIRTRRFGVVYDPANRVVAIAAVVQIPPADGSSRYRLIPLANLFSDPTFSGFNTYYKYAEDTIFRLPHPRELSHYYADPQPTNP
jgi:hypothetical protein